MYSMRFTFVCVCRAEIKHNEIEFNYNRVLLLKKEEKIEQNSHQIKPCPFFILHNCIALIAPELTAITEQHAKITFPSETKINTATFSVTIVVKYQM